MAHPNSHNGRRPIVNWQAARAYWLALPDERRTFVEVGRRFKVSSERVGQIARREDWQAELELQDAQVETELRREILNMRRSRAERVRRYLEIADRAGDLTLELLPLTKSGELDLAKLSDAPTIAELLARIPQLARMADALEGRSDVWEAKDVQPVLSTFATIAVLNAPPERRAEVILQLQAASAGLLEIPAVASEPGE